MCLGLPGRILEIEAGGDLRMGRVAFGGAEKRVCLDFVPDAGPGEWVLVHVGFALSRIDEAEAARVFAMLDELDGEGP